MQFTILAAATLATAVSAAPANVGTRAAIADNTPFGLIAIRSGSDIQYSPVNAAKGSLFLQLPAQNATCEATSDNTATFVLNNGTLSLYTPSTINQTLYTDRSGMGQGVLKYSTAPGGYGPGRNSETQGWVVDDAGDLTFAGSSLLACPNSIDGAYSLWVSAGSTSPAGNSNCTGIAARTSVITTPNACTYTFTAAS